MPHPVSSPATAAAQRLRVGLGTYIAIDAWADTDAQAIAAIESAFAAIAAVDAAMHPARAGSALARINAASPGTRLDIDVGTHQLLELSRRLHALTQGVFDPCLPERPGSLSDLEWSDAPDRAWVICRKPLALDFGGLAKGYAVDRAVAALRERGCRAGLVNAGGDMRLFGDRRETVFVRRADGRGRPLALAETALAVSDLDACERPREHRGYYVRGRRPTGGRRYAAVLAHTAAVADALTKCLLLCPETSAQRALAAFGARSAG
ncbi:MAG TPA: FAD:protein FMN transferase [Steroidobacteraceae bacterium]|nr:FAD:protein FMN transferase [Steroidobacteraceae bacterium]